MDYNYPLLHANSSLTSIFDCCGSVIEVVGCFYKLRGVSALSSEESCFHILYRVIICANTVGDEYLILLEFGDIHKKDMVFSKVTPTSYSSSFNISEDLPYDRFTNLANSSA